MKERNLAMAEAESENPRAAAAAWAVSMAVAWICVFTVPLLYTIAECVKGKAASLRVLRRWLSCIFMVFTSFASAFLCGLLGFFIAYFAVSKPPPPLTAQCTILTHSVDLRSEKVCELGFLNYNAKNILLARDKKPYRCKYDYYWASVFKVEYKQTASNDIVRADAEAPKEALPLSCRPDFNYALKATQTFKVNETYLCKYTPGKSTVDIIGDDFFNCSSAEPSAIELIHRLTILIWDSDKLSSELNSIAPLLSKPISTIFAGMFLYIIATNLRNLLTKLNIINKGTSTPAKYDPAFAEARLQVLCLFTASIFVLAWSSTQCRELNRSLRLLSVYLNSSEARKWLFLLQRYMGFR